MAVNKNGGVPIAVPRSDATTAAITAATLTSGLKFGEPTVFNSSGSYTIPATATINSSIMVESVGGGAGGGGTSNIYAQTSNLQGGSGTGPGSRNMNERGGGSGNYFLGIYRLGFLSTAPASTTVTVTVGAGGNGANMVSRNQNFGTGDAGFSIALGAGANAGGTSSVTYASQTFASATGGSATSAANTTHSSEGSVPLNNTLLTNLAPRAGLAQSIVSWTSISGDTASGVSNSGGQAGRNEFGATLGNIVAINQQGVLNNNSSGSATVGSAATNANTFGQGGGYGVPFHRTNAAGTFTFSTGGNGGPGGGGGGVGSPASVFYSSQGNFTFNALTGYGGAGGAGRVRIWFQA